MSEWVKQDDWSQVHVGDIVRLSNKAGSISGPVKFLSGNGNEYDKVGIDFGGAIPVLYRTDWQLSVPVKPAVELPTEPGIYVSYKFSPSPVVVHKLNDGRWVDAGDENYVTDVGIGSYMPLVRVEPVAVTAKKVLDRMREDNTERDGRIYPFQYTDNDLEEFFAQFGVTDE